MSHTQGKLELEEVINDSGQIKHLCPIGNDGFSILTVVEHEGVKFAAVYKDADARRLVACWNACDGISTETLEHRSAMESISMAGKTQAKWRKGRQELANLTRAHEALKAQRDELLAALKDVTEGFSILKDSDFPALGKARAAIANTKGAK